MHENLNWEMLSLHVAAAASVIPMYLPFHILPRASMSIVLAT